tara:strand:- start:36 stop:788 length:753 start_codon:yes stop_codon:yes gene_type:complete
MNELTKNTINSKTPSSENIATRRIIEVLDVVDLDDCSTILDVGSWHLKQAVELADIFKHATVYAFEPNPPSYDLCLNTHSRLPFQTKNRIKIFNKAASDKEGKSKFYALDQSKTNSQNLGMSSLNKLVDGFDGSVLGDYWVQKEIDIDCIRMDNWLKQNNIDSVDILWMDVQGAENLALLGFGDRLKDVKIIFTEAGLVPYYENHCLKSDIDNILEEHFVCLEDKTRVVSWASDIASEADIIYLNKKFVR